MTRLGLQNLVQNLVFKFGAESLITMDLIQGSTGSHRDRIFVYQAYLAILNEGTEPL